MKLAFITNYYSGDELDVVTSSFFKLIVKGLRQRGHFVKVFTLVATEADIASDDDLHCAGTDGLHRYERFYQLNSFPVSAWLLSRSVELKRQFADDITTFSPDAIICVKALDGLVWVKEGAAPVVLLSVTPHFEIMRLNFDQQFSPADVAMVTAMEVSALRSMAKISCPSADVRNAISQTAKIIESEMSVYPHPIDLKSVEKNVTHAVSQFDHLHLEGSPIVAYIGTLERYKGFDILMRAIPAILQKNSQVRFVFAGETPPSFGEKHPYCESVLNELDNDARSRVEILKPLDEGSRVRLARQADLVVYPFRYCGCMYHVLESMAAGGTVITSNIGSLGEFLTHRENSWLVAPEDSEVLATEILRLLADRETLASIGRNAIEYVREKCSPEFLSSFIEQLCAEGVKSEFQLDPAAPYWLDSFESFCTDT